MSSALSLLINPFGGGKGGGCHSKPPPSRPICPPKPPSNCEKGDPGPPGPPGEKGDPGNITTEYPTKAFLFTEFPPLQPSFEIFESQPTPIPGLVLVADQTNSSSDGHSFELINGDSIKIVNLPTSTPNSRMLFTYNIIAKTIPPDVAVIFAVRIVGVGHTNTFEHRSQSMLRTISLADGYVSGSLAMTLTADDSVQLVAIVKNGETAGLGLSNFPGGIQVQILSGSVGVVEI